MPRIGPIKRRDLIKYLLRAGYVGPFVGPDHEFMTRGAVRLRLPNRHMGDIGPGLLVRILRQAGIERTDWEEL